MHSFLLCSYQQPKWCQNENNWKHLQYRYSKPTALLLCTYRKHTQQAKSGKSWWFLVFFERERGCWISRVKCQEVLTVKLDLILSSRSSLRWPLPESRKQGFGIIWGSSSSKRCFSFHWIWWCRACLRHPKHINMVCLYPQRDFSMTVNK